MERTCFLRSNLETRKRRRCQIGEPSLMGNSFFPGDMLWLLGDLFSFEKEYITQQVVGTVSLEKICLSMKK